MTSATEPRIDARLDHRGVARVTIDNAGPLNALNSELLAECVRTVMALGDEPGLRAVVVTGAGERAFVGGADIREMAQIDGPDAARAFITGVHGACAAVRGCPVPVIARI